MNRQEIEQYLESINHSIAKRKEATTYFFKQPSLTPLILEIAFTVDSKISTRATWLLEFMTREHITFILPYLDLFCKNMKHVYQDASVRPIAKICEHLIEAYYKENSEVKKHLTASYKEQITELCFDYLISNQKVAAKAYSMNVLFLLGKETDWIHPALKQILQRDINTESAAFKARAKQILKKIA